MPQDESWEDWRGRETFSLSSQTADGVTETLYRGQEETVREATSLLHQAILFLSQGHRRTLEGCQLHISLHRVSLREGRQVEAIQFTAQVDVPEMSVARDILQGNIENREEYRDMRIALQEKAALSHHQKELRALKLMRMFFAVFAAIWPPAVIWNSSPLATLVPAGLCLIAAGVLTVWIRVHIKRTPTMSPNWRPAERVSHSHTVPPRHE